VGELADRCAAALAESARLNGEMAARDRRIAELEGELRRLQQARHDVVKRIDDMIGQIDQLETQLVARAE
jgi:septal ring factor EnvC (AmiA/AmiB activator)